MGKTQVAIRQYRTAAMVVVHERANLGVVTNEYNHAQGRNNEDQPKDRKNGGRLEPDHNGYV